MLVSTDIAVILTLLTWNSVSVRNLNSRKLSSGFSLTLPNAHPLHKMFTTYSTVNKHMFNMKEIIHITGSCALFAATWSGNWCNWYLQSDYDSKPCPRFMFILTQRLVLFQQKCEDTRQHMLGHRNSLSIHKVPLYEVKFCVYCPLKKGRSINLVFMQIQLVLQ